MIEQQEAMDCEQYLLNNRYKVNLPSVISHVLPRKVLLAYYTAQTFDQIPCAIGRHPNKGWFVLGIGQGPMFIWKGW